MPACVPAGVIRNEVLCDRYRRLRLLAPDVATRALPGQFVMLTVSREPGQGPALPRPMAVAAVDVASGEVDIVYGVVGGGTRQLASFAPGERIVTVGPLGRGFDVPGEAGHALLLGRGVGTCSLTLLSSRLVAAGWRVTAVSSARTPRAQFGPALYPEGVEVVCVEDTGGSSDVAALAGLLAPVMAGAPAPGFVAACGSRRLEHLAAALGCARRVPVQVSVEAHMACGLGYCHGCASGSAMEAAETPLVCLDGPVFAATCGAAPRGGHSCHGGGGGPRNAFPPGFGQT